MHTYRRLLTNLFLLFLTACSSAEQRDPATVLSQSWAQIEARGRNQPVTLMMWLGDPFINDYMNKYVKPEVKKRYGIDLQTAAGQGTQVVQTLVAEREAGQPSQIDMAWINGETFYQLRQIDGLLGPITDKMPNAKLIDFTNPYIGTDFQQPVAGMEAPWGNVQLAIIYDGKTVPNPPRSFAELPAYVKAHPGQLTIPNEFTGMTLLKSWMIALAGNPKLFQGKFREEVYLKWSTELWKQVNAIKPYFWKQGTTFPEQLATLHQLFANGEVAFTFSDNDAEVDNKVNLGFFPKTARAYVPAPGTIRNSHYLGIVKGAQHPEAAMLVVNFLMSPEAQLKKMDPNIWGDHTVLDLSRLTAGDRSKFENLPTRRYAPKRAEIQHLAFQEPAPEYMTRLFKDFRTFVIEAK
ncbi:ABC transporter substrate-binding protein [Spirosoma utsteinense]|uniref:Spermidine/putrescine transport system substrate-binding protein n=1 Tax=Spirosoma utsteinense TaxID=2585773 RepID=A0ABR6W875_9BACT|nr:ABC transporter substrate-binding protein [Spirosoma utsteinense]MBC3784125.1 putative spermidine/putrescine transport system substrate-binding protein [Spirosoma utsteinense]MBC3792786.1 putative spermidine/putrescine transport system substrate-binding protein [Spirosoma utsteinense]